MRTPAVSGSPELWVQVCGSWLPPHLLFLLCVWALCASAEHGRWNHSDTGSAMPVPKLGTWLRKHPPQDARLQGDGWEQFWEAGGSGSFYLSKCHTVLQAQSPVGVTKLSETWHWCC